ncbi:MAG TPA: ATPase domain-containing protein, partial [Myxococcota bacterium]|nr:ATPase domain-containing protein [Myxococcota bacterium]
MARVRSVYACTACGAQQPRWLGRCPECGSWSSLVEERVGGAAPSAESASDWLAAPTAESAAKPRALAEIDADSLPRLATGVPELDRVLGGGLVPGSVVLLAGEPGVGKSTLALQLAAGLSPAPVLYVSGEESPEQIRLRADRMASVPAHLALLSETRVESLAA